ncbi:MAG: tryptophan synthase subunit alpha [Chthonomonadales bacterium]
MTRLSQRFARLREQGERALITYIMAGDPSPDATLDIVQSLDAAGVDAVELGIPFSDPLADGPLIQQAGLRALAQGMTVQRTLELIGSIRRVSQIPIVIMTYFNPVLRYGVARFAADAASSGADGVIQTDLTPEEAEEWIASARASGVDTVFLVAPTSTDARIATAASLSTGFVYCVSRTGVTGARDTLPSELADLIRRVKAHTPLPVCVGFGISTPQHVRQVVQDADGAVVGSALVRLIAEHAHDPALAQKVREFAASLKQATRRP